MLRALAVGLLAAFVLSGTSLDPVESAKAAEETPAGEAHEQDTDQPPKETAEENDEAPADAAASGSSIETAKNAEKGTLKNPYAGDPGAAEQGHEIYMAAGCNGCHGGTGGGGMGPPLTNPVWIYGSDGDTLFRLIALGTEGLEAQGYTRTGSENVVGPMPEQGTIVKSTDDMWKMIAWIHSINE